MSVIQMDGSNLDPLFRDHLYSRIKRGAAVRTGASLFMGVIGFFAYLSGLLTPKNIYGIGFCVGYLIFLNIPFLFLHKTFKSRQSSEFFSVLTTLLESLGYSGIIYFLGGIRGLYLTPIYAVLISYLGITAPVRFAFFGVAFSGASLGLLLALEYHGFLPHMDPLLMPVIPGSHQTGIFLAVMGILSVIAFISSTTGKRLRHSRIMLEKQNQSLSENAQTIAQAEEELRQAHQELEQRVEERTLELQETNDRLQREIRDRHEAEKALRESEARFSSFMQNLPGLAIIKDHERRVLYMNPKFKEQFDILEETLLGKTTDAIWSTELKERIQANEEAVLSNGQTRATVEELPNQNEVRTYRSVKFPIPQSEGPPWIGGIAVDITELKEAEEERIKLETQIREVQKLESLGVLAGGIAHDFNNLLMIILGNVDLAALSIPEDSEAKTNLSEITKASRRATELCNQMLAYAGKARYVVTHHDLSSIVREMSQMLEISISKKASLFYSFAQEPLPVKGDITQLRQIIMNLITNASEALGENSGRITISTGLKISDHGYLSETIMGENLPEGPYVFLEVTDTGCGMDPETNRKIFDPFFTTKFTGRGLGLAAVLGIVRGHKGTIKIVSEPGRGTTIRILFPRAEEVPPAREGKPAQKLLSSGEGETILLVDDDPHVRQVGAKMLQRMGYTVMTAINGRDGVEIFRQQNEKIACVILDLTMPEMSGEEAFMEMRRFQPKARIILASGYNEQDILRKFSGKGLAGFIQKPYSMLELQKIFSQVFERP